MANLLVITGNTALKAAWSDGTVLGKTFRYQGEKMLDYLLSLVEKEKPEVLTIASVCDILAEEEKILKRHCSHLIILDENHTLTEGILVVIFLLGAGPERKRWKDIQRIFR